MHPQVAELLDIVKRGEAEAIEAARDLVRPELLPELLAAYWQLSTWDDKSGLMQLFSDYLTTGGQEVMLDFLTAPTTEMNDEYYTSGKIVALCQLAGTFEFYERLWYDRPLCAAVIERALSGETSTLALVDALDKPKPAAPKPQPHTAHTRARVESPQAEKTKNSFRRLFRNETVFIIVNTAFWLGLLLFLITHPYWMLAVGLLLALVSGIYLLYAGFFPRITRGMAEPGLARGLFIAFGLLLTLAALAMTAYIFHDGIPSRQRTVRDRLATAARGYTWLNLSDMGLRDIPPEVWDLEHLTELDLRGNRLDVLPPDIARLTNLQRLSLDDNRLEVLPPEIGQLVHLEWLDLDGNRLTTLPPEFARLQSLTHLQLQYNRWEAFPNEILELPNLELLFLAGNRLGDLPPVITARAEAGELDLWYKPYASRFNWSVIIVIGFGFVLPMVLSVVIDRWWTRRELAQRQAARQTGEVFAIPPQLRSSTLFVIFASSAVSLFMLTAALNGPQTGVTMEAGVGLCLLFSPLVIGGLLFLSHNSGMVLLTAEGVLLRRPLRRQSVRYADITAVTSQARIFAPGILIRGQDRTLRIPRMLENLPRCYTLLLQRVSPVVRDASLGNTAPTSAATVPVASPVEGGPVYAFTISRRVWALNIGALVLFILIYLGIGLLGIWSGLARGEIPPFNTVWVRNSLIFFAMISVFFLPALIYFVYNLLTKYGPFKMERPVAWEFYRERIRYRFPRGDWEERSARALQSLTLKPLPVRVRGGRGIETRVTLYMLVLEFADAAPVVIDHERAVQFGQTPERLHAMLIQLYENQASSGGY